MRILGCFTASVLLLGTLVLGCRPIRQPEGNPASGESVISALVAGRQEVVDAFTRDFLAARDIPPPNWLLATDAVSPSIIVKVETQRHIMQLGVEQVGDYFLCLLEAREGLSTEDILEIEDVALARSCGESACEICNSLTRSPSPEVRLRLSEFWSRKRRQGASSASEAAGVH